MEMYPSDHPPIRECKPGGYFSNPGLRVWQPPNPGTRVWLCPSGGRPVSTAYTPPVGRVPEHVGNSRYRKSRQYLYCNVGLQLLLLAALENCHLAFYGSKRRLVTHGITQWLCQRRFNSKFDPYAPAEQLAGWQRQSSIRRRCRHQHDHQQLHHHQQQQQSGSGFSSANQRIK